MQTIEKKIWPEFFEKVLSGNKQYEVRLADFVCSPNDVFVLKEWDPKTKAYTGRVIERKVADVMRTKDVPFWSQKEIEKYGLQIISLS